MMTNSVYASTARFDSARALTEDELYKLAPSVFATQAHESRSERFRAIPTIDVIRALAKEGFAAVGAKQAVARDEGKAPFTKHLIRFRRIDDGRVYQVGDTALEIILKNGNDGSSAYDLMAGLFRALCLNSLVAQTATIDSVKVRHSGRALDNVIEGTYRVLGEAQNLLAAPQDWSQIQLNQDQREAYAAAAHVLRFGDAEGNVRTSVEPEQLLIPRRSGDTGKDLWTVTNVVQENAVRGGLTGTIAGHRAENGQWVRPRRTTTRAVNGIEQDVKLNKALWVLSERLAKTVKAGAPALAA